MILSMYPAMSCPECGEPFNKPKEAATEEMLHNRECAIYKDGKNLERLANTELKKCSHCGAIKIKEDN